MKSNDGHYWPHNRGVVGSYAVSPFIAPFDLNYSLAWRWPPEKQKYDGMISCGPLIDGDKNIYIAREDGVRKFDPLGNILWIYEPEGVAVNCPSLLGNTLYGSSTRGFFFALDLATGKELWNKRYAPSAGGDTAYTEAHEGVVVGSANVFELVVPPDAGDTKVLAMNASDGALLWDFTPDSIVWNFIALFPDDGTVIFQDKTGVLYRLSLTDGSLIWKSGMSHDPILWTDGGPILGSNNIVYSVWVSGRMGTHNPVAPGRLNAYRLTDGALLWYQVLPYPPNSWPAVGRLKPEADLSVVIPIGQQAGYPFSFYLPSWFPSRLKAWLHELSLMLGDRMQKILWNPTLQHQVWAFDAATGTRQWSFTLPPYRRAACGGDEEGLMHRSSKGVRLLGLPNPFSNPTIGVDGTVYVGNMNNKFYSLRDLNGDGVVEGLSEVKYIDMESSFQNPGCGLAPGMLAVVNHEFLWVFKYR